MRPIAFATLSKASAASEALVTILAFQSFASISVNVVLSASKDAYWVSVFTSILAFTGTSVLSSCFWYCSIISSLVLSDCPGLASIIVGLPEEKSIINYIPLSMVIVTYWFGSPSIVWSVNAA